MTWMKLPFFWPSDRPLKPLPFELTEGFLEALNWPAALRGRWDCRGLTVCTHTLQRSEKPSRTMAFAINFSCTYFGHVVPTAVSQRGRVVTPASSSSLSMFVLSNRLNLSESLWMCGCVCGGVCGRPVCAGHSLEISSAAFCPAGGGPPRHWFHLHTLAHTDPLSHNFSFLLLILLQDAG